MSLTKHQGKIARVLKVGLAGKSFWIPLLFSLLVLFIAGNFIYYKQKQAIQDSFFAVIQRFNCTAAQTLNRSEYCSIIQQESPLQHDLTRFSHFLITLKDDNGFSEGVISALKYREGKLYIIASTVDNPSVNMSSNIPYYISQILNRERTNFIDINQDDGCIQSLYPFFDRGEKIIGLLEIKLPLLLLKQRLAISRNKILYYSVLSFLLIFLVSFFISRKNNHPVANLVKKLENMKNKPIDEWELLDIQGDEKVIQIADFINSMITQYRQLFNGVQVSIDKFLLARSQLLGESNSIYQGIENIAEKLDPAVNLRENLENSYQDISATAQLALDAVEQIKTVAEEAFYSIKRMDDNMISWVDLMKKTSKAIDQLDKGLDRILEEIDEINPRINGVNSSLRTMSKSFQQLDISTQELSISAEKTATFIEQMEKSIDNINTISHNLSRAADETSNLMVKMAYSIQLIESNAKKSRELSEIVASDVEQGMSAIKQTIEGMDRINKAVEEASRVIKRLGDRSQEIGEIINVIEDIAEQTNLLALNASIIAAQAGEQGRGFAVVADEIRGLAARTSSSTQDIAKLILTVQDEVRNAVQSMQEGSAKVEQGVKLSNQAGKIFEKILKGTRNSTEMVKKIAEATVEQTDSSSQVVEGIKEVTKMIQNISRATTGHISSLPEINKVVDSLSSMAKKSSQAIAFLQEQSEQIIEAMSLMKQKSLAISRGTKEQKKKDSSLSNLIDQIGDKGDFISKLIGQLTKNITNIRLNFEPMKQKLNLLNNFKSQQQAYSERLSNYLEDINQIAQMQMKFADQLKTGCLQVGQRLEDISKE